MIKAKKKAGLNKEQGQWLPGYPLKCGLMQEGILRSSGWKRVRISQDPRFPSPDQSEFDSVNMKRF